MKYYLQIAGGESIYDAGYKARRDADACLSSSGYVPCMLRKDRRSWVNNVMAWYHLRRLASMMRGGGKLFIQYPYYLFSSRWKNIAFINSLLSRFDGEVECLIHDIHGLREGGGIEDGLASILLRCAKVIVHTPEMKNTLVRLTGIDEERVKILYLFDYLSESVASSANASGNTVVFAGNLRKSTFINGLRHLAPGVDFNLYGVKPSGFTDSANCRYKGKFQPEEINQIEGDWGLAWDGDSIETCSGSAGEYLRFNSSHKISLYLAACKPVIIWEESSLRDFICGNHLGISVRSLHEINERLAGLSVEERQLIETNVRQCSERLRSGYFLKRLL